MRHLSTRALTFLATAIGGALLLAACSGEQGATSQQDDGASTAPAADQTAAPAPTSREIPPHGTQLGVAGLIPRNFPSEATADWLAMYEGVSETGRLLGVYGGWFDEPASQGETPAIFRAAYGAADRFGFIPVVGLGFHEEDVLSGDVWVTIDWTDREQVERYVRTAVAIARERQPPFMLVGTEINRIWEQDRAAFDAFVVAWPQLYEAIKEASPGTQVGTGFQLEFMRGAAYLSGESREQQWDLLDRFRENVDLFTFSTYPYFDFGSPEAIPDDYYAEAAARAGVPIAFTSWAGPRGRSTLRRAPSMEARRKSRQPSHGASSS